MGGPLQHAFLTGHAEERLSFDIQRISRSGSATPRPGLRDVERFMKHYFLIAKDVGDLTAILCAGLESRQAKPVPMLNRMVARLRPRGRRTLRESHDFIVDNNRINIADSGSVCPRSGQSHPHVPTCPAACPRVPSGCASPRDAVAQADR